MLNQTSFMKITRFLSFIAVMAIVFSCSKDEEPEPNIEQASLSLSKDKPIIEVPAAMATNEDEHAQMASGYVTMANGISSNLAMFTPPSNAVKSTTIITPLNGRIASTNADAVVYTWIHQGTSIAYQIRDLSDKYTYELFYKGASDTGWYRYLHAQEMKDKSAGYMVLYDLWNSTGDRSAALLRWDWTRKNDLFTVTLKDVQGDFSIVVSVNTKTKAGSVIFYEGKDKLYEMTWDTLGNGTWKSYEDGIVTEEGTWTN
jgi:hypothetical protein